jgi:hypothetical protein
MFISRVRGNPTFSLAGIDALAGTIEEGGTAHRHPSAVKYPANVTSNPGAVQLFLKQR